MASKSNGGKPPFDRLIAGIPQQLLDGSLGHVSPQQPRSDSLISKVVMNSKCLPRSLGESLELDPTAIDDAIHEHPGDKVQQKEGMVYRWIEVKGKMATLRQLLEALYNCDDTNSIRIISTDTSTAAAPTATDRHAHSTAFVSPIESQRDSLQTRFGEQCSVTDSPVLGAHKLESLNLLSVKRQPLQRSLSTPGSDSDWSMSVSEEAVRVTMTAEDRLETAQHAPSILVGPKSSGNGLQVQPDLQKVSQKVEEHDTDIKKHDTDIKVVQEKLWQLELKHEENVERIGKLDTKILELQEENKRLREKLIEKDNEIKDLKKKLKQSQSDNQDLQSDNQDLREKLRKAEEDKQRLKDELNRNMGDLKKNGIDVPDSEEAVNDGQFEVPTDWKFGDFLGKGSFGEVYICEDLQRGVQRAVKVITIDEGKELQKSLQREMNALKLRHDRIVPFYGTDTYTHGDQTYLYIFMEYIPGGSLLSYMENVRKRPLSEELTRSYTVQLVEGVVFLHSKHIIHRDIKCANILRGPSGLKLADFGCSKQLEDISVDGRNSYDIGTAHWRAPESIKGNHSYKSDVWSIGATVVEMLTTKPPLCEESPLQVIYGVGSGILKPTINEFSSVAREFLEQCFRSEESERPSATDLLSIPFCSSCIAS